MIRGTFDVFTGREAAALVLVFAVTLPAVTPRLYASDEVQYYSYLRSLWFDRDVSFDNEYRAFYERGVARTPGFEQTFLQPVTATGKRENFGTIGSALLWAPFYAAADAIVRLSGAWPADGYSPPYIAAVAYGSAFYGFLAIALSIAVARRLVGDGILAGLAVWFGTPLLFYMYAAPPFAHACSAFAVALFVTVWLHVRRTWSLSGIAALGAAAALMTMVREQDVFYAIGPAIDYVTLLRTPSTASGDGGDWIRRWSIGAVAGIATFVVCYSPQLFAYLTLNGRFGPSTLVTRKLTWTSPYAPGVLASPSHGLFAWTPLALFAVIGLILFWLHARRKEHGRVGLALLMMFLLQVYVSGSVESWTVAGAFGQRRFIGATVLFVVGIAMLWTSLPAGIPRTAAAAAGVLAIWWNIGMMVLFGAGLMDRQRLTLARNAYDVFLTLPREGPELVYRYFTDRRSFYKPQVVD